MERHQKMASMHERHLCMKGSFSYTPTLLTFRNENIDNPERRANIFSNYFSTIFFWWFKENHKKSNPDKCHLLVTTNILTSVNINGFQIINSTEEKLLGIKFDIVNSLLKTMFHSNLCQKEKASEKLHALTRIVN